MSLSAIVRVAFAGFTLNADVTCNDGETVAIVGRNGAGKTTLLRAIAGLEPTAPGTRIELGGVAIDDVAAEGRGIGYAFQDNVLFPHLDALDNVAFGLRARGVARDVARERAADWLSRLGMGAHHESRPATLSGGEAQRVALARALAIGPKLLLLDEPLAALDAATRNDVRRLLRDHLREFAGPRLLVTHDPVDAAALADRVVVLEEGRVVQTGTPAELTARPRHAWVADLAGTNLYRGDAAAGEITLDGGGRLVISDQSVRGAVYAAVNPRAVVLSRAQTVGSARNRWEGRVAEVETLGGRLRVRIDATPSVTAEITIEAGDDLGIAVGASVWAAVKATEIDVYPA